MKGPDIWLSLTGVPEPVKPKTITKVGLDRSASRRELLIRFYKQLAGARNKVLAGQSGRSSQNMAAATRLLKAHTFKELLPSLVFFVVDWNGENVDEYGRTLLTFEKNLPAIVEEYDQMRERDYVKTRLVRYRMWDEWAEFVPEDMYARAAATRAQRMAEMMARDDARVERLEQEMAEKRARELAAKSAQESA